MWRVCSVLVLSATRGLFSGGEAQGLGAWIKKKVEEKTTPKKADSKGSQATGSGIGFELTEVVLEAFHRGVTVELRLHREYIKRLATLKSQEQYQECTGSSALVMGPDGMKMNEEYMKRMEKVTTQEEMMKVIEWLEKERKQITLRHCGEDPQPIRSQQVEVFRNAEMAGAMEFGKAFDRPQPPSDPDQAGEPAGSFDRWADWCALSEDIQEDVGSPELQPWLGGCRGELVVGRGPATDRIRLQGPDPYLVFCMHDESTRIKLAQSQYGGSITLPRFNMAKVTYSQAAAQFYQKHCQDDQDRYRIMKEWTAAFCALPEGLQDEMANRRDGGTIGPGLKGGGMSYTQLEARDLRAACSNPLRKLSDLLDELMGMR